MIQSIKINVMVGDSEEELEFDYSEVDDMVYIYLDDKYICSMDYDGNFKQAVEKIKEKW